MPSPSTFESRIDHPPALRIRGIREQFVDVSWKGFFILAVVVTIVNCFRARGIGWVSGFTFVLVIDVIVAIVFLTRNRLPYAVKSALLVFILWISGVAGVKSLGLSSTSFIWFACACFASAVLFERKTLIGMLVLSYATVCLFGVLFVTRQLKIEVDLNRSSLIPLNWLALIAVNLGGVVLISLALRTYSDAVHRLVFEVARQRDQIAHMATHDNLTGLPVMAVAYQHAEAAIGEAANSDGKVAMLFIDLDGFKDVNDTYGHEAGDRVLAEIARRLKHSVRSTDTAARVGGDEFAVVLPALKDPETAAEVARKIIAAVSAPIPHGPHLLSVGASIGISIFPEHARSVPSLRKAADETMYRVKKAGKNGFDFAQALH